jgi:hypothetical protein
VLIATTIFESGRIIQSRSIDRDKAERSLPLLILVTIDLPLRFSSKGI